MGSAMKFAAAAITLCLLVYFLLYDDRNDYEKLEALIEDQFGESEFVWLIERGYKGVLIFGYVNNLHTCEEMARDRNKRNPTSIHWCERVSD